ncbi:hypothetical protein ACNO65_06850 [Vibrio campbellii]|uniref:hypothetical protein n=1 Tax=Vibrio campbellii TaxID=680 RepID=UPI003AAF5C08
MGFDLHPSILPYWEKALNRHSNVSSWERLDDSNDYIYRIKRVRGQDILVLASDCYEYSLSDFFTRNDLIGQGTMIYMAKPESQYDLEVADIAKQEHVTIGMLGEILGALNLDVHWNWESKDRKERRKR